MPYKLQQLQRKDQRKDEDQVKDVQTGGERGLKYSGNETKADSGLRLPRMGNNVLEDDVYNELQRLRSRRSDVTISTVLGKPTAVLPVQRSEGCSVQLRFY
jgi:hypothetical protein